MVAATSHTMKQRNLYAFVVCTGIAVIHTPAYLIFSTFYFKEKEIKKKVHKVYYKSNIDENSHTCAEVGV
jgi:hypothetical protein